MPQQFGREVPDLESKHRDLAHREVPPRRRVEEALVAQCHGATARSRRPSLVSSPWNSMVVSKPPMVAAHGAESAAALASTSTARTASSPDDATG